MPTPPESLREMERRLNASQAEAERLLPALRELPADRLLGELQARTELRTASMMRCLLGVAAEAPPDRAYELTSVVVACAARLTLPGAVATMVATIHRCVHAEAWREHARALHALRRPTEARAALSRSRALFECDPGSEWYVATVDLVEAPILYEQGARTEALQLVRSAATHFAVHGDRERYVDAVVLESSMLCTAGDRDAAANVWLDMAATARQRADSTLTALIVSKLARFELGQERAGEASRLFASALVAFDAAGYTREAIQTRRCLAEAMAERGRLHEAVSELYKAHAQLLADEDFHAATVVFTDILDLLLATDRLGEIDRFTEILPATFAEAGMPPHTLAAFHYLRSSAARGTLDAEDIALARSYFEDLPRQPNAPFIPPVGGAPWP